MSDKLRTEQEVKDAIALDNWSNLSKDKAKDFLDLWPEVDRDVARSIVEQFAEIPKSSAMMVDCLKDCYQTILEEDRKSADQSIAAYNTILDDLSFMLKKESNTFEEKSIL